MRELKYWVAPHFSNDKTHNIRGKTRIEVVNRVSRQPNPEDYGPPERHSIVYRDALDLVSTVATDGGLLEPFFVGRRRHGE